MKKILSLTILTFLLAMTVSADIPMPDRKKITPTPSPTVEKDKDAEMTIEISSDVTEPTLVISRDLFGKNNAENSKNANIGIGSIQMIVGGLFLSLAFVFGGVWLARGKEKLSKAAIGILVTAIFGFAGAITYANVPPPLPLNKNLFKDLPNFPYPGYSKGNVKVRLSDDNDSEIRLIIPRDTPKTDKKGE